MTGYLQRLAAGAAATVGDLMPQADATVVPVLEDAEPSSALVRQPQPQPQPQPHPQPQRHPQPRPRPRRTGYADAPPATATTARPDRVVSDEAPAHEPSAATAASATPAPRRAVAPRAPAVVTPPPPGAAEAPASAAPPLPPAVHTWRAATPAQPSTAPRAAVTPPDPARWQDAGRRLLAQHPPRPAERPRREARVAARTPEPPPEAEVVIEHLDVRVIAPEAPPARPGPPRGGAWEPHRVGRL